MTEPTPTFSTLDFAHMSKAIQEARNSNPEDERAHPKVGAVIASPNGVELIASYRGAVVEGRHAEHEALDALGDGSLTAGATAYTTLEPCTTRGPEETPCVERLISAGVSRVVIGTLDPNPAITGRGWRALSSHNIRVDLFPFEKMKEIEADNADWRRVQESTRYIELVPHIGQSRGHQFGRWLNRATERFFAMGPNLKYVTTSRNREQMKSLLFDQLRDGVVVELLITDPEAQYTVRHFEQTAYSPGFASELAESVEVFEGWKRTAEEEGLPFSYETTAVPLYSLVAVDPHLRHAGRMMVIPIPRRVSGRLRAAFIVEKRQDPDVFRNFLEPYEHLFQRPER